MPIGAGAVIGIGASILGGVMGASSAKKAAQAAAREKARLQNKLSNLEKNRQDVVNPYEDFTNLSGMITNPFANLGVATGAAEIKIEEADVSLANTLDTMRATGASAGGATALAQAALQSKKGISASIQQQEAQNQKLSAQGAMDVQEKKAMGQMKVDEMISSGEEKVMLMQGQGKSEIMQIREARSSQDINNASGMQMNYLQMQSDAAAGMMQADIAQSNMFSSLGGQFLTAGLG
jgi:hypothetical protein